jgi:hypothetical protein
LSQSEARTWASAGDSAGVILFALMLNLPNAMVLVSPWLLYRQQRGKGVLLTAVLGCSVVLTWFWGALPRADQEDLRIGYFVWSAGVTLAFLAWRPGWRTLIAMFLVGLGLLLWLSSGEW